MFQDPLVLKTNRAVGLDKIGARLLKDSVDVITPSLTNLEIIVNFNKMLETVFILNTHPINRLSKAGAALVNTISSINGTLILNPIN